jgi:VanZ family protein
MPTTGWDKLNHILAFFVLLGLLDNAYPALRWLNKLFLLLVYGVVIECWQGLLPAREFSLLDVVADGVGLLLYWAIRPLLSKYLRACIKREAQ